MTRRGNIRMGCSDSGFTMEYLVTPTETQLYGMLRAHEIAEDAGIETCIIRTTKKRKERICMDWEDFLSCLYCYCKGDAFWFALEQGAEMYIENMQEGTIS